MNRQDVPESPESKRERSAQEAAQHVSEAHQLLKTLRDRLETHPELDEAIERLEMALSALTIRTGGML